MIRRDQTDQDPDANANQDRRHDGDYYTPRSMRPVRITVGFGDRGILNQTVVFGTWGSWSQRLTTNSAEKRVVTVR